MPKFDFQKHKGFMQKILKDIYSDNTLGPLLGFKGGTAALLFYDLNRNSVDLDFDLLDEKKEDFVFSQIEEIISKYGSIVSKKKKYFTLFFELSYEKNSKKIKVEINRRNFGSKYEVLQFYGISMQVMIKEDMFANKLCAMYERIGKTSRDIFDVWFFLNNDWPINKKIVEERLGKKYKDILGEIIKKVERLPDRNMLSGLGELVDSDKDKIWIKTKLKNEILFLLKVALGNEI